MRFDDIFPIPAVIAVLSIDKPAKRALQELEVLTEAGFAVAIETHPISRTPDSAESFRALRQKRFLKGMVLEADNYHLQELARNFGASFLYVPSMPQGYEQRELVRGWSRHSRHPRPLVLGGRSIPIQRNYHTHISPDAVVLYRHHPFHSINAQELKDAQHHLRGALSLVECCDPENAGLIRHTDGLVLRVGEGERWTSELVDKYSTRIDAVGRQACEEFANEFYR